MLKSYDACKKPGQYNTEENEFPASQPASQTSMQVIVPEDSQKSRIISSGMFLKDKYYADEKSTTWNLG